MCPSTFSRYDQTNCRREETHCMSCWKGPYRKTNSVTDNRVSVHQAGSSSVTFSKLLSHSGLHFSCLK